MSATDCNPGGGSSSSGAFNLPGGNGNEHDKNRKSKFQMNSCFVCNLVFVAEKKAISEQYNNNSNNHHDDSTRGKRFIENLCLILEIPGIPDTFIPEDNPLCTKCCGIIDEFFNLERQLQFLIKMLWEMRRMLGRRAVDSFTKTQRNRRNFDLKCLIVHIWRQKLSKPVPLISSTLLKNLCSEESSVAAATSLLNLGLGKTGVPSSQPAVNVNVASRSAPEPGPRPVDPNYTLLDISNNNSTTSSVANYHESGADNNVPPGETTGHPREDANYNENSNMSMECPSPVSPPGGGFDDIGGTSGNEDVYVSNLPPQESKGPALVLAETETYSGVQVPFNHDNSSTQVEPDLKLSVPAENNRDQPQSQNQEPGLEIDRRTTRPIVVTHRRNHSCKFCGKLFPSNFAMEMHARIHTGEKPFSCSTCGRPFANKAAMQKHEMTHDRSRYEGEPQFECDVCGKKYHLKLSLATHKRDHTINRNKKKKKRIPNELNWPPKKNYKKKKKPRDPNDPSPPKVKVPRPKGPRRRNIRLDVDGNPIVIEKPPPKLDADGNPVVKRKRTVKLDADGNPIVRRKQPPKPRSDSYKPRRKRRILGPRRTPGTPKEPQICEFCGKDCVERYRLVAHLRVHDREKGELFKCPICVNTCFSLKFNFDKHMKNAHDCEGYEDERSHVCDFCGKAFFTPGTLYHHRRRNHLGLGDQYRAAKKRLMQLPGECKKCGEKFQTQYQLRRHEMRKHTDKRHKCSICGKPFYTPSDATKHESTHDPKWYIHTYFRHQCIGCPPEALGFASKDAVREHWALKHPDEKLPEQYHKYKNYKKIYKPLPPGPGKIFCLQCPEEMRPRYRQLSSLKKHERAYHSGDTSKVWRPGGESGKGIKRKRQGGITEDDDEFCSSSESESGNDVSDDFKSDSENDIKPSPIVEPIRRSVRRTRGNKVNIIRLLGDSEDGSDAEDYFKASAKSSTYQKKKVVAPKASSKLTASYIYKMLKGREVRLILTRVDSQTSENKKEVSGKSAVLHPIRRAGPESKIPPPPPLESSSSSPAVSTSGKTPAYSMLRRGRISPTKINEQRSRSSSPIENIQVSIYNEPVIPDLTPEVKEETGSNVNKDPLEDETITAPAEALPPPASRMTASAPTRNFPIIIHNPLSKNKATVPIIIPPRSIHSSPSARTTNEPHNQEAMDVDDEHETVLGF